MLIEKLKVRQGRIQRNFDTTDAVLAHKLWHPPPPPQPAMKKYQSQKSSTTLKGH